MLRTLRAHARFRSAIETALRRIRDELDVGHFGAIEANSLQRVASASERPGSKPLFTLEDHQGRRYVFKLAEPGLAAAEEAAYALRRLGGRPTVPARAVVLDPDGRGPVCGLLKPYLHFDTEEELSPDTRAWSAEQRAVLLMEHAWEWLLDNLDTNTSQYALLGPHALPVNIDWDRAFFSDGRSPLSRFAKYKSTLPNARTFLYADYVERKIELPLRLLEAEAVRIRRLPLPEVAQILERYARVRFEDDEVSRREFVQRIVSRQRRIEREVRSFLRELVQERRQLNTRRPSLLARGRKLLTLLWAQWQVVLNSVLRGPVGNWARGTLTLLRGRRRVGAPPTVQLPDLGAAEAAASPSPLTGAGSATDPA